MSAQCPHRPPCTACPRFGEPGLAAGALAELVSLARRYDLPSVETVDGPLLGFRLRARLAIRGRQNSPKIGLFEEGSHRVVHIPRCSIQHPLINRTADIVRRALVDTRTPCYSDAAHLGLARHLQVVVERQSQTAQVVVVANAPPENAPVPLLDCIRERMGAKLHSLWFNSNTSTGNVVLGSHFTHWAGPMTVVERFGGSDIHYGPGAFGQSNLAMADQIIARIREALPARTRIAEFYAGAGAIGLSVIDRAEHLVLNEISPPGLESLACGLAALAPEVRDRIALVAGTAGEALAAADGCDVVIADPPRKGLDAALRAQLANRPPQLFLYVSCGVQSLVGDTAALVHKGRLRLKSLTAFNQFPFTEHVETLARFERA